MKTVAPFAVCALAACTLGVVACAIEPASSTSDETVADPVDDATEELRSDRGSPKWLYRGPLPTLEGVTINVSLKAHTARVTGLLPTNFQGKLPFYAKSGVAGTRPTVTVVYPIATGALTNAPGNYSTIIGVPWVPTDAKATWGGFPFLKYHLSRGIAFHGPITAQDHEWKLLRGPVSHGCNRMQGEHVVELAQLIGLDMRVPHRSGDAKTIRAKVSVSYDYDQWQGALVDVDYPTQPSVKRPSGANVAMFSTWSSDEFPRLVCAYDAKRPLDEHHCDAAGTNRRDVFTGK